MGGALSDERMGLSFTIAAGTCQHSHSQVQVPQDSFIFYCLKFEIRKHGGPGPSIYIPRSRVAQLYPQTLGSVFVAFYDSQGYGGGSWTYPHMG
jgi:hypothetical protein